MIIGSIHFIVHFPDNKTNYNDAYGFENTLELRLCDENKKHS